MSVQKKSLVFVAVCTLAMACTATASAGTIMASSQNSASHIAFDSTGTLGGVVFGNPGTYDGIEFSTWNSPFSTAKTIGSSSVSVVSDSADKAVHAFGGGDQYQYGMYNTYTVDPIPLVATFSGLDSTKTYLFQFGFYDSRHTNGYNETVTFTLSDSTTATQALRFGDSTDYDYGMLSVTVSGTTSFQLSMPTLDSGHGPSLDGFAVSTVVPEPGTIALLATGLIGLLCYAWKKRK